MRFAERCPASAHGCDFETRRALTLKDVEDGGGGDRVLTKLPDDLMPGPCRPCGVLFLAMLSVYLTCLWALEIRAESEVELGGS